MPRNPSAELPLRGLLKFQHLRMLFERIGELAHLPVRLILDRIVAEHETHIVRQIFKNAAVLLSCLLGELEQIHIVHAHQRPLRHHGHCLHRVQKRLRRNACAIEAVGVEFRGRSACQLFCQLREIVVPQERLLAAEDIEIPRGVILEVLLELPQGIVRLPGLFFCHQFPPRMTMVPISSVR